MTYYWSEMLGESKRLSISERLTVICTRTRNQVTNLKERYGHKKERFFMSYTIRSRLYKEMLVQDQQFIEIQ